VIDTSLNELNTLTSEIASGADIEALKVVECLKSTGILIKETKNSLLVFGRRFNLSSRI